MDPDQALKNAREAAQALRRLQDEDVDPDGRDSDSDLPDPEEHASTLLEAFEALDGWLSVGGFLPQDWSAAKR